MRGGVFEEDYGEFPQTVASVELENILENLYVIGNLNKTGKEYPADSVSTSNTNESFKERFFSEYEYNGNKYIRIVADTNSAGETLSNGQRIEEGRPYFVLVEPITWIVDSVKKIVLAKKIIFSGVQFNEVDYTCDFDNTNIKKFMDKYLAKAIIPSEITIDNTINSTINSKNVYDFNFDNVSEEDIIKGAIESNIPVFLHGKSSDGKSARVKELDPDCEIIYMANATPSSLNGKSVYNSETKEMIDIPPTWYQKVLKRCEAEPDKIHIIFFDELTNALPSVQGQAFNIVLDKEIDGKWKLPSNARIVAAGNELSDSMSANKLSEPLYNRFAHVYIETTVSSWLKWAVTPKENYERLDYEDDGTEFKIHPAIYAYISYKYFSGIDVLRTKYTGNKPNADPRKWEMASKVLYKTRRPDMLRALVGEELTVDFKEFVRYGVITVDDVINHNYTETDLNMNSAQKFVTAAGLSSVDFENFRLVRDFMKLVGSESRAAFESMWAHGDKERLEYLVEIEMEEEMKRGESR